MADRADEAIAQYLATEGYHPRSSKHGDALCTFLLTDLLDTCREFSEAARRGTIAFQRNYTVGPDSPTRWNVDLVIGPPASPVDDTAERVGPLVRADPKEIWIAVDAKTIMTEHGKARRNRQRDLNSFQDILHRRDPRTIVAGLVLVNIAERFKTPLPRRSTGPNIHKNVKRLVAEILTMLNGLPRAGRASSGHGLEALGAIVVSHSNLPGEPTLLVTDPPAPQPDEPLGYSRFLRELCGAFVERFSAPAS